MKIAAVNRSLGLLDAGGGANEAARFVGSLCTGNAFAGP